MKPGQAQELECTVDGPEATALDPRLIEYLDDLYRLGREHDAGKPDRLLRLRNVEPDTARLLAVLVRALRARDVLELGTSNGYSTVWLADAVRAADGRVVSVDVDADRTALARENLRGAALGERVQLRTEDAGQTLRDSPDEAWDVIFLDAERPAYVSYWPDLVRVLRPAGLLVVDNVLSHADQVAEFRALVASDGRRSPPPAPARCWSSRTPRAPTALHDGRRRGAARRGRGARRPGAR